MGIVSTVRWPRLRRLGRFLLAICRHIIHGLPTASPEDQAARWAICEPCEWRDKEKNSCKQCGCNLQPGQMLSKIRWAGEQCPLLGNRPGPWWGKVEGEKVWARAWRLAKEQLMSLTRVCVRCGKYFRPRGRDVRKGRWTRLKFCSKKCRKG